MAAKTPAAGKVTAKAKVTTKAKATPKGLVLSTAQWKAYNKAYSAAASAARTRIAFRAASNRYRAYRLASAYASVKRANAAGALARTSAIAAYATRMSFVQSRLGHQNASLQARIETSMYNHANIAGRLQYSQAGEQAYAHKAILRTVDEAQANAHETQVFRAINKTAKKASKSTLNTKAKTKLSVAQSAAISKAGNTAGLKAAARVRTAPRSPGAGTRKPGAWVGDETEPLCVAYAIANHLLYSRGAAGIALTPADVARLSEAAGPEPTIESALWAAYLTGWPNIPQERPEGRVRLADYREAADYFSQTRLPLVIGYPTMFGDHCGLSLPGGEVVSWGAITTLKADVEEAWELTWKN